MTRDPARASDELPPPSEETLRQRLTYWGYRAAWEGVARLPDRAAWELPAHLGPLMYRLSSRSRRDQARRNLARVSGSRSTPDLDDLVAEAHVQYARYWVDAFRLHRISGPDLLERTTGEGLDHLAAVGGQGGILATAHLGSWDAGAYFCAQRGWRLSVVTEVLEPRRLFQRFVDLRRRIGLEVIPLVRGTDMIGVLEQHVRDGRVATLVADRDLTRKGPIVDFFGAPCRLPPGPAALARRTGRPVTVGAFLTTERGWHVVVRPPVEVAHLPVDEGTQVIARELENLIGAYPAQWHVFMRQWLADREPGHPALGSG